jgi:hypothetical protein
MVISDLETDRNYLLRAKRYLEPLSNGDEVFTAADLRVSL